MQHSGQHFFQFKNIFFSFSKIQDLALYIYFPILSLLLLNNHHNFLRTTENCRAIRPPFILFNRLIFELFEQQCLFSIGHETALLLSIENEITNLHFDRLFTIELLCKNN